MVKLANEAGMLPVKKLSEKSNQVKFVKLPKEAGMPPPKALPPKDNLDKSANVEIQDGIIPSMLFLSNDKTWS